MWSRRRGLLPSIALVTLAVAIAPAPAGADGDPASDVLGNVDVFYPYGPPGSAPLDGGASKAALNRALAQTRRAGLHLQVAIIASRTDLGLEPRFFGRPRAYARFLASELGTLDALRAARFDKADDFTRRKRLLVAMPAGFGTYGFTPRQAAVLRGLSVSREIPGLIHAATLAVQRLAASSGHRIREVTPDRQKGRARLSALHALLAVAMCLAVVTGLLARSRRTARRGSPRHSE